MTTVPDAFLLPPHSIESEQWLLGALLIDPTSWERVADVVTESDLYRDDHKRIFSVIRRLAETAQPIDVVIVAELLQRTNQLDLVGGISYLGEIANACPSSATVRRHAQTIAEKARLRALATFAGEVNNLVFSGSQASAQERIEEAMGRLLALSEHGATAGEPLPVREILGRVVDQIQERFDRGGAISGLETGFIDLDDKLDGLKPGDLVIVAGRPSMGKTAIAINIAENVAIAGHPAMVFSLEMTDTQLIQRTLSSTAEINGKALASGRLNDEHWDRMTGALSKLHEAPLWIDQSPNLSVAQMLARARRTKRKEGRLALVVVDYLQLMTAEGNNRNEVLGTITRGLKLMARDLGCPVICLSQLSRECEKRADKRPMLADLRESGAIEQDADVVVMMYRDDYYTSESPYKGLAECLIRKNRMGEVGDVRLVFQPEYSRFRDADPAAIAAARRAECAANAKPRKTRGFDD